MSFIEIPISLSYLKIKNEFIVIFSFNKRAKGIRFIRDKRYNIYDNFEKKILQRSIKLPCFEFDRRIDDEDSVNLIYNISEDVPIHITDKYRGMFIVSGWVPPSAGCDYCKYKENDNENFFHCHIKSKTMTNEVKNCKVFMQENYK